MGEISSIYSKITKLHPTFRDLFCKPYTPYLGILLILGDTHPGLCHGMHLLISCNRYDEHQPAYSISQQSFISMPIKAIQTPHLVLAGLRIVVRCSAEPAGRQSRVDTAGISRHGSWLHACFRNESDALFVPFLCFVFLSSTEELYYIKEINIITTSNYHFTSVQYYTASFPFFPAFIT